MDYSDIILIRMVQAVLFPVPLPLLTCDVTNEMISVEFLSTTTQSIVYILAYSLLRPLASCLYLVTSGGYLSQEAYAQIKISSSSQERY